MTTATRTGGYSEQLLTLLIPRSAYYAGSTPVQPGKIPIWSSQERLSKKNWVKHPQPHPGPRPRLCPYRQQQQQQHPHATKLLPAPNHGVGYLPYSSTLPRKEEHRAWGQTRDLGGGGGGRSFFFADNFRTDTITNHHRKAAIQPALADQMLSPLPSFADTFSCRGTLIKKKKRWGDQPVFGPRWIPGQAANQSRGQPLPFLPFPNSGRAEEPRWGGAASKPLTAMTLTKVVLPEYCSPTSVSSISSFQKSDRNQSSSRDNKASMVAATAAQPRLYPPLRLSLRPPRLSRSASPPSPRHRLRRLQLFPSGSSPSGHMTGWRAVGEERPRPSCFLGDGLTAATVGSGMPPHLWKTKGGRRRPTDRMTSVTLYYLVVYI